MRDIALVWYGLLSSVYAVAGEPLRAVVGGDASLAGALLLGVLGALSPCQLSTNAAAFAYLARGMARRATALEATAYILGKMSVYTVIGLAAVGLGEGMQAASVPVAVVARRLLGPLMLAMGLVMLGIIRPRLPFPGRAAVRAATSDPSPRRGIAGAFGLGAAFSLAWCPTFAVLFFGWVIPWSLSGAGGVLYPGAFALGTTLPVALAASLLAVGLDSGAFTRRAVRAERILRVVAGVVFLLAGANDTVIYWLI